MRQAIADYLEHAAALGFTEATQVNYRKRLGVFHVFALDHRVKSLPGITGKLLNAYHDDMIERDLAVATRMCYLVTLQGFLKWAYKRGKTLADLSRKVVLPAAEDRLPPMPPTQEEMAALIRSLPTETVVQRRDRAIVEMFYATGVRRSELIRMNVGDVDFKAGTLYVHGKGGKDRLVPIHVTARQALTRMLADAGALNGKLQGRAMFVTAPGYRQKPHSGGGGRISPELLQRLFETLSGRLGKHLHPHLLRHAYAVHLLQNGADVRHVQALLGHESPDTTSRYLGLVKADLKRAYDAGIGCILSR